MKKILTVLLMVAMIFCCVSCGKKTNSESASIKTAQKGKLVMGTHATFPPYEFISDDGSTIVGIDVEIAKLVADELGLELQIEDMEFASILTAVQSGKVDVGLAGMTVTEERLKNVNFSKTYAKGIQSVIVPESSTIQSIDDLKGKKIGVQESTTGHIYCEDEFGSDSVVAFAHAPTAVQALLKGFVDCVVIDDNPAKQFVKANKGLKILPTAYTEEDYAAAMSKENTALLDAFNNVLEKKIADGTIQKIIDKYISAN